MKSIILLFALTLSSCCENDGSNIGLPRGLSKFRDGDYTCYMYYQHSVSCVKDPK